MLVNRTPRAWPLVAAVLICLLYAHARYVGCWHPSSLLQIPQLSSNANLAHLHNHTDVDERRHHPIQVLARRARRHFEEMVEQQSQSYEAAVIEYNRRYHRIPPPGFQKWFEHAKANACPIIDNFDVMERDLAPFHQLSGREVMGSVEDARKSEDHKANFCRIEDGKWLPEDCVGELADNLKNVVSFAASESRAKKEKAMLGCRRCESTCRETDWPQDPGYAECPSSIQRHRRAAGYHDARRAGRVLGRRRPPQLVV